MKKKYLTFEDFDEKYNLDISVKNTLTHEEGRLETYGKDLERAIKLSEKNPKRLWTAINGDIGFTFVSRLHFVDSVYYMITVEEWVENEEYIYDNDLADYLGDESYRI